MQDLQLIGVHEDGEHLLLSGAEDSRFRMPVDEALRAAIRRDRPRLGQLQIEVDSGLRPRDVQALIRAGASAEEAAERAGWSVEKVHRYEGPIVAEREHVAGLARKARLRARSGISSGGSAPTLSARVAERLTGRGVEVTDAGWDAWRAEEGPWTIVLTFAAGGRQRQASWSFDLADKTVSALDDEARWLSEEVQAVEGPIPAPQHGSASMRMRATAVYDVEADGGLRPAAPVEHQDDPLDLMTAMRKRSTARGRRQPGGHRGSTKATPPQADVAGKSQEQSLPLEDLLHDANEGVARDATHGADDEPAGTKRAGGIAREVSPSNDADQTLEPVETSASQGEPAVPATRSATPQATRAAPPGTNRKTGRPKVPAWDEIMFGSRSGADRSSS